MNETAKPLATSSKNQIRELLQSEQFRMQVAAALPQAMSGNAARFARIALTATFKQPRLLECSQASLLNCLLRLSELGLEPDGRRAHLIPYKDECTLLLDYKGIAELVRRNGDVVYIHCDVVGENDHFDYRFGTHGKLDHVPKTGDRGRILCAYSFIRLKDGTEEYDVMSSEDIERVRSRSRAANDGPWVTDWAEMAKKTIFRRHAKLLPLTPEVREMIETDDESLSETERFNAASPVRGLDIRRAEVAAAPALPKRGRPPKVAQSAQNSPQPQPEILFSEPQMPQDRVLPPEQVAEAQKEQNARESLLERVQALLRQNGFDEEHLLEVLHRVNLATDRNSLADVAPKDLATVLEDWENCQLRLKQIKAGK